MSASFLTSRLVEGQTVEIGIEVIGGTGAARVNFDVNGAQLATDTSAPYSFTFTVPFGLSALAFGAEVLDSSGATVTLSPAPVGVDRDSGAVITGRVVDAAGNPVGGVTVNLRTQGLTAEFFDSATPLASLPDLTGATTVRSTRVTALNMRAPGGVFGADPQGIGLAPDYAARYSGWLQVPAPGTYTFSLGADEGARLQIGGITVVDIPTGAANGFQEGSGAIRLEAGVVPIEVTFYQSTGSAELQLSFLSPAGERQVVPPAFLVANGQPFRVTTDAAGRFEIRGVPGVLQDATIQIGALGRSDAVVEVRIPDLSTGAVDVGDVQLPVGR
jgi:hypothetical protein